MSRIVIDARESGTSTGRYIDKLIEHMHTLKPQHEIVVLAKKHRLDFMKSVAPGFQTVETPFKEFSLGEQLGFRKQIKSLKPDLVHFGKVEQPILYTGRAVTTMHDLTTVRFRNPTKNAIVFKLKQQVYKIVNIIAAHKSRVLITPTQYVKNDVVKFAHIKPAKVTVTLESADAITGPATPVEALKGKQFIMYIGRPMLHKNLGRLMDAFKIMQETNPELYLVLAGKKDPLYDAHEKNAKEKGIKNIIFTGFISDGELKWLYQNTACYVFPSLSEGFGLPPLEAMIHGAPVASSNATCLPEVNGDAADYFDPLDSRGMAEVVLNIINNNAHAEELKQRGKVQVAKYSWDRMTKQTLEVYDRALS
ncbi:MAG: glycosyl transferase family 1 [Candidatus Saccharibacteria bacterium]|nr:glycosyl transferase family 1 [Candidatus Saccharibacteria bacterium]